MRKNPTGETHFSLPEKCWTGGARSSDFASSSETPSQLFSQWIWFRRQRHSRGDCTGFSPISRENACVFDSSVLFFCTLIIMFLPFSVNESNPWKRSLLEGFFTTKDPEPKPGSSSHDIDLHQFKENCLSCVSLTGAELEDPRVSAVSVGVVGCDLIEKFCDCSLVHKIG